MATSVSIYMEGVSTWIHELKEEVWSTLAIWTGRRLDVERVHKGAKKAQPLVLYTK